jgi:hypothetical protein
MNECKDKSTLDNKANLIIIQIKRFKKMELWNKSTLDNNAM